jgi:hypothetical protein
MSGTHSSCSYARCERGLLALIVTHHVAHSHTPL